MLTQLDAANVPWVVRLCGAFVANGHLCIVQEMLGENLYAVSSIGCAH